MTIVALILRILWRVVPRRLRSGRRHPSWSLLYEVGVEVCREALKPSGLRSTPGGQRAGQGATQIAAALRYKLDFAHGTLAGLPTEIHTPKARNTDGRTLLYLHGGGYVVCSPATYRALVARIAHAATARALVVDYRKAPEHPFPAAIDDCLAAYHALLNEGVEPTKLLLAGDSAGGGLALAVLQRLRDERAPLPAAVVLLSPWVDLSAESGSIIENDRYDYLEAKLIPQTRAAYLNGHNSKLPLVSPLYAELSGLPPMLLLTGTLELFYDQNLAFVEAARAAGVEVSHEIGPDQVHVYPLLADFSPYAAAAIDRIAAFIRAHT